MQGVDEIPQAADFMLQPFVLGLETGIFLLHDGDWVHDHYNTSQLTPLS
jgi:hypothetical protein